MLVLVLMQTIKMARMKTFFIYFLLIVLFFIYSQIMIYIGVRTTYKDKDVEIETTIPMEAQVKATSVNGIANVKIKNTTDKDIEGKYIKLECYSKHDTLMGTKYIQINKIGENEEKEFEIEFKYNEVEKAIITIVDEMPSSN